MDQIRIGDISVSRMIIGGNPFSGFSHQSPERNAEMKRYYTTARIKETLQKAESLGINSFLGRTDAHIMRVLAEYWDEGGTIQWIAQTAPELNSTERSIEYARSGGAKACYIHGGQADYMLAQGQADGLGESLSTIRAAGMPAGIAGHNPLVFEWTEANLDADFYMCCYYNPSSRDRDPEHVAARSEWFKPEDRDRMTSLIKNLKKPVIHYKIMAAGRNNPTEAFRFAAGSMRPGDAVCVGFFTKDNPDMIEEDIHLFESALAETGSPPRK